jgi:hypothetical protein
MAASLQAELPREITFNSMKLVRKTNQKTPDMLLAEYIPAGETLENWTVLLAIRWQKVPPIDLGAKAISVGDLIQARKAAGDPVANAVVMKTADGSASAVDFMLSEGEILEHDIQRYSNGRTGFVSYQFAQRIYHFKSDLEKLKKFVLDIQSNQPQYFSAIMAKDLPSPEVSLQNVSYR